MKSRFLQLFERYPGAMVIVDRAGQIHQANSQAEQLFGYTHDKLRGESVRTLFPGQSVPLARRHLDLVGSSSDLRQFPAEVSVIPIRTERGSARSRIESTPGSGTSVEFWVPDHGPPEQPKAGHDRVA